MDERPTLTDCDEAGDYVVPNVLSPRDLVFRPDTITIKSQYIPIASMQNNTFTGLFLYMKIYAIAHISNQNEIEALCWVHMSNSSIFYSWCAFHQNSYSRKKS